MLSLPPSVRIYLSTAPADMRKGFDGLLGIVRGILKKDPMTGHLFVFISKRQDRAKILWWDIGGFVLYYKRLEMGKFRIPRVRPGQKSIQVDSAELAMLLDGIDYSRVRRPVPWQPKSVGHIGCTPKKFLASRAEL